MPIHRCKRNGKYGYQWGNSGKCYIGPGARAKAAKQAAAIRASGYQENTSYENLVEGDDSVENNEGCAVCGCSEDAGNGQDTVNVNKASRGDTKSSRKNGSKTGATKPNPLRTDPTKTATLRRLFTADINRRFSEVQREINKLVVDEDAFGLKPRTQDPFSGVSGKIVIPIATSDEKAIANFDPNQPRDAEGKWTDSGFGSMGDIRLSVLQNQAIENISINQRFMFHSTPQQVDAFRQWLSSQLQLRIMGVTAEQIENAWFTQYVQQGYEKGAGRAWDDFNKSKKAQAASAEQLSFFAGSKHQFLQQSFAHPESVDKVKLLAGRVFSDLKGITEEMSKVLVRNLTDGLVRGQNPRVIASTIAKSIGVSKSRAETIAMTEITRAHAEGQLLALEKLGATEIGVAVEWSVSGLGTTKKGYPSPCKVCAPMKGVVFTIEEAKGLLPRHPRCRCSFVPANVGEEVKGQNRSKSSIEEAITKSVKAEIPKGSKTTLAKQKKKTSWPGVDKKIAKKRPKAVLNTRDIA